jgi:periplasmic mercuric ion binding protein
MKTLKYFSLIIACCSIVNLSIAQKIKTETFAVSGNCGMCKSTIEKAAKDAGATYASWNVEKKELTIKYTSSETNTAKIQKKIAEAGYDNVGAKASDESYNNLHKCCQYDRTADTKTSCCDKCDHKEGKCTDMKACKDKNKEAQSGKSCCDNASCSKKS